MKVLVESDNSNLLRAYINPNNEYYTRIEDIEKELSLHKNNFKNKIIYCNCDDVYKSEFIWYFIKNFNEFNLKKLIATGLSGYKLEINKVTDKEIELYRKRKLTKYIAKIEDGDYSSTECLELLKECDIVITNPPFSLFRDYIDTLFKYNKDFIVIGHAGASSYLNIFSYIYQGRLNIGYTEASHFRGKTSKSKSVIRTFWYTTFNVNKPQIELTKEYDSKEYPKYDNIEAIDVSRYKNIPRDYYGVMGVPVTFLKYYTPTQFKLLGLAGRGKEGERYRTKVYKRNDFNQSPILKIGNKYKILYVRVLIKQRKT